MNLYEILHLKTEEYRTIEKIFSVLETEQDEKIRENHIENLIIEFEKKLQKYHK